MMTAVVMRQPETRYCVQRLRGLDPKTYYQDEETGTVYSGAMLMNAGLNLTKRRLRRRHQRHKAL